MCAYVCFLKIFLNFSIVVTKERMVVRDSSNGLVGYRSMLLRIRLVRQQWGGIRTWHSVTKKNVCQWIPSGSNFLGKELHHKIMVEKERHGFRVIRAAFHLNW